MIPSQRSLFDIPDDVAYFNCGYMSPLLNSVTQAGIEGIMRKANPWSLSPVDFFTESNTARQLFADIISAGQNDIAIIPSASYGIGIAARNLQIHKGQHILVLEDQFPSNIYAWQELAKENDAEIQTVLKPANQGWTQTILHSITPKTAIAALPHCLWTDGGLLDLEKIGEALRSVGAKLVLDVTQSLGAMPLDINRVKPDFLIAASYKWLLGPYSVSFIYVAPEHQDGIPLEHNWLNRKGSEDFSRLVDYQDDFQPGAIRFDMGQRANFALMPMAVEALRQILKWGVQNIYETLTHKTAVIAEQGQQMGLKSVPLDYRAGHFLGLQFDEGVPDTLLTDLANEKIYVSARGNSLRVTPHLYNTEEDADKLIRSLKKVLEVA